MEEADRAGVVCVKAWSRLGGGDARVSGRLAAGAAAVLFLAPVAGGSIRYRVELLSGLNPTDETYARAVNDSGEVAGEAGSYRFNPGPGYVPVRWEPGTSTPTRLDAPNTRGIAYAWGINRSGDVVGDVGIQASVLTGIRWSGGGTAAAILPGLSGAPYNTHDAYTGGIDDQGNIAGYAVNVGAFRLRAGESTVVALGDLGIGTAKNRAKAVALNNRGDAIGNAPDYTTSKSGGQDRAVIWPAGATTAVALPFLLSTTLTNKQTYANAINDTGLIAGTANMYSGFDQVGTRAVLWSPESFAITDLSEGAAKGINNDGDVVGQIPAAPNGLTHAALWARGESTAIDLNTLIDPEGGWVLQQAADISNTGIIVGSGLFDPDGDGPLASRAAVFRLTPVPEPMATAMMGLGWCFLGRRRARRRVRGDHKA